MRRGVAAPLRAAPLRAAPLRAGVLLAGVLLAGGLGGCTVGGAPSADSPTPAQGEATASAELAVPAALPAIELSAFDGSAVTDLSTLRGPLVINLWASYCQPCRTEMPMLAAFHRRYGDRVDIVGIDYLDPQPDRARQLAETSGVEYRLLTDPDGELSGRAPFPALRGLPFLAFVDAEGRVTHQEYSALTSEAQLTELVEEHLGVSL